MTALLALGLAATPLFAQTATVPDPPPAPSSNGVVGPRELQDFSLPGAVVRPADPVAPAPSRPRPSPTVATPPADQTVPATRVQPPPTAAPARRRDAPVETSTLPPAGEVAPPPAESPPFATSPSDVAAAPLAIEPVATGAAPLWPWLLALLAAGAAAAAFVYFRRQQDDQDLAFAGAGLSETLPAAPRVPAPRAAQPVPRAPPPAPLPPIPPPPVPGGIVSTALRPEIELIFTPLSVAVDEAGTAMVVFDLVVHNHGSAPARDVLVEAGMFNAGPEQDALIGTFFANPRAEGDRIPLIAPMSKIGVRSRVSIPADRIGALEMAGRKLLVPLVAFNALFRWSGGETQRSASFLVGRGSNDKAKLAPFALDRGSRAWGDVAARSHSMGLAD